jgi:uncharacterized surface anchored protein
MGASFTVYDASGAVFTTATTDATGTANFADLAPGDYTVQETAAPSGYLINDSVFSFTIPAQAAGRAATIAINDGDAVVDYQGSVSFKKTDAQGNPLADIPFTLTNTDTSVVVTPPSGGAGGAGGSGGSGSSTTAFVSDADGIVTASGLAPGHYAFSEEEPATGSPLTYVLNTAPLTFEIPTHAVGAPAVLTLDDFVNYQGSVTLTKQAEDGAVLAGAKFTLYGWPSLYGGSYVDETATDFGDYTTASDGTISVRGLAPG